MVPTAILMLFVGLFIFSDSIIAINFAGDAYHSESMRYNVSEGSLVRFFVSSTGPINTVAFAFTLLFAVGIAARFQVNRGRGDMNRAIQTQKSGTSFAMIISVILIPILLVATKP
jgi:Na+-driven multidrug efflux pump